MQTAIRVPPDYWVVFLLWWPSWLHFKPFLKLYSLINESIAFPLSLTVIFIRKSVSCLDHSELRSSWTIICPNAFSLHLLLFSSLWTFFDFCCYSLICVIWGSQLDSFSSKNARLRLIMAFSCIRFQTSQVPPFSHRDWEPISAPRGSEQNGRSSSYYSVIFDLFNLLAKSNYL